MADFITLSCPSCGNKLHIIKDIDRVACAACGNAHTVNRSGGVVTLKPVIIDNTIQSDNIITQAFRNLGDAIKNKTLTPAERQGFMEILDKFKKEMEEISEAEAKQRKAEESTKEE